MRVGDTTRLRQFLRGLGKALAYNVEIPGTTFFAFGILSGSTMSFLLFGEDATFFAGASFLVWALVLGVELWKERPVHDTKPEDDAELAHTAVHEAGHAIAAWFSPWVTKVDGVSIKPKGLSLGRVSYVLHTPALSNGAAASRFDAMAIALGGIAAEAVIFGKLRSGSARQDLLNARSIAMEIQEGFLCPWTDDEMSETSKFDVAATYRANLDECERDRLNKAFRRAKTLVVRNKMVVTTLVEHLLEKRELEEKEIARILGRRPWAEPAIRAHNDDMSLLAAIDSFVKAMGVLK